MDNRLHVYRRNCARIPSVTGEVVPEPVFTIGDYRARILERIYADLAPHDPDAILRDEWANARGAIARFVRNTIEIRVLDVQECPAADLAIAAAVVGVLRLLVNETWSDLATQQRWPVAPLAAIFERTVDHAERATIDDRDYLELFGHPGDACTTSDLWQHLITELRQRDLAAVAFANDALDVLLQHGPLARRVQRALGSSPTHEQLRAVYQRLCEALAHNRLFIDAE